MTFHNFLLSLGIGSALLALWFVMRFPDRTPENFTRALMHVGAALLLGPLTPHLVARLWAQGYAFALVSIFGVLLPILFYTFLSGAWFFKLATDTIQRYRH
jgi:VIT1/CCC1 family predicted Fe2+/Mn2+ transporter